MNERKCPECGEIITTNIDACPKCGCPLPESAPTPKYAAPTPASTIQPAVTPRQKSGHTNKSGIVSLILGILIFMMGVMLWRSAPNSPVHSAGTYDVPYSAFGGDFYTEIYAANDTMADALTGIDSGIEAVSVTAQNLANGLYTCAGMITMAMGLMTIAISLPKIKKA